MGTSTLKSVSVTNLDATPSTRGSSYAHGGGGKYYAGKVLTVAADDTSSLYRMFRIRSGDRCHALSIFCDAGGGSSAVNIGLWKPSVEGGAVVDADFFASAVSLVSALNGTDVTYESANAASNMGLPVAESRIWEILGLTADPIAEYDVGIQPSTAITNAINIVLRGTFIG